MRVSKWQVSVALVCVLLGLISVVQLRTQSQKTRLSTARSEILLNLYEDTESHRRALVKEIADLRQDLAQAAARRDTLSDLNRAVARTRVQAGLTEMKGPGITLQLNDSQANTRADQDQNAYLIHDEDLLLLINELLAGGARGIAINGQRWTSRTEIRCAGPTASVNQTRVAAPFVIQAVGDPDTLESALKLRGGVLDALRAWGIQISIDRADRLRLPAFGGSLQYQFARPVSDRSE